MEESQWGKQWGFLAGKRPGVEPWKNETGRSETIINEAELAAREDIVFDPQTSGGLLLSIDSQDAARQLVDCLLCRFPVL